jgi:hypothetical protein
VQLRNEQREIEAGIRTFAAVQMNKDAAVLHDRRSTIEKTANKSGV